MKNIIKVFLVSISCFGLFVSCKHTNFQNEGQLGPNSSVGADFSVSNFTALSSVTNTDKVDFTGSTNTEVLNVKANLSIDFPWKITISGKNSKATKVFVGTSKQIDLSWNGVSDSLTFFTIEDCDIKLEINGYQTLSTVVSIIKPTNFSNVGLVISDFDGVGSNNSNTFSWSNYPSFNWYGSFVTAPKIQVPVGFAASPQGGKAFYGKCTSGKGAYFSGGFQTGLDGLGGYVTNINNPSVLSVNTRPLTILKKFGQVNTDDLYLNVLVNYNNSEQTILSLYFKVWDTVYNKNGQDSTFRLSPSYTYNIKKFEVNNKWQYFSVKLSDILFKGFQIENPTNISTFGIDYGNKDAGPQTFDAAVDLIMITKGAPLFPKLVK